MKRIVIFRNGSNVDGKVIAVTHSLEEVLQEAGRKVGFEVKKLYTPQGGLVDDIKLIRDEDVMYVSPGEPFIELNKRVQWTPSDGDSMHTSLKVGSSDNWITLNVGGRLFTTTRSTLTGKETDSMLARMFADEGASSWQSSVDEHGAYLIDRSPIYFEPILNYLRHGQLILDKNINPQGVLEECKFFGITSLVEQLEAIVRKQQPAEDFTPISRREFVFSLMSTNTTTDLRCQGLNFTGADLSKLDLRHINFRYAILKGTNLSGANLSQCNFERADLSHAILDGAILLGAKFMCACLEGALMKGCNFEDPAGSRANMEGANMKNVNLEGSHMAGVNLRVATLKNSNLKNCDLRAAVLAGADLENCDLSGCDLQEANLRGANLKGASLELMLNPLHMSQTIR
ncbi:BTB/POZ domain-containing protein KCTD9 [Lingula anatina]|uniref:BTB/POZ domain-containing protein KCTD9 n=1 Tax=Lingula anatina TaxID=7574 RepID=A0A1S3HM79_LINAN|nr:BTB/POZ domain-containing protein KCTD9-like isoform X1 [Lingula anatina]XP_013386139.1 BTB/POZ domain-containing protein KCTD9-like isoform X2 [Lingula anatina]XP_013420546.1 BTB/POZ domain-containing protein KCTD9 [Lingula anatina]|eukprot:XP_013386138.1 BTB/POZ domain-containing protein KCTD9-like isoform X1 [Lingula anatina]